jgi:hypothetical protein
VGLSLRVIDPVEVPMRRRLMLDAKAHETEAARNNRTCFMTKDFARFCIAFLNGHIFGLCEAFCNCKTSLSLSFFCAASSNRVLNVHARSFCELPTHCTASAHSEGRSHVCRHVLCARTAPQPRCSRYIHGTFNSTLSIPWKS